MPSTLGAPQPRGGDDTVIDVDRDPASRPWHAGTPRARAAFAPLPVPSLSAALADDGIMRRLGAALEAYGAAKHAAASRMDLRQNSRRAVARRRQHRFHGRRSTVVRAGTKVAGAPALSFVR
ncbi:hypothetical protein [Streptomyces sp. NPDC001480]|uniref:hypothetical protein n=1 Tax=Streptomyces sp. NPDC001480 TaxID=3364577 RepID=UPI0036964F03